MGSIQCALLGYGIFLPFTKYLKRPFGPLENVVVQTIGVATATLPLAGGFIGIIPALGLLAPKDGGPVVLSVPEQLVWGCALTYFGIFFAVPLRRQTILVEKLAFPSGTATAKLIDTLHGSIDDRQGGRYGQGPPWCALLLSFLASFGLGALSTFALPHDPSLHVGNWVGFPQATNWMWKLRLQLALVGQGMIMGPRSAFSLLLGAVLAWAVLGPYARSAGWAPGKIGSFTDGAQGWVLWVSIALMVSEALAAFGITILTQLYQSLAHRQKAENLATGRDGDMGNGLDGAYSDSPEVVSKDPVETAPQSQLVPTTWWVAGLVASLSFCVAVLSPMFSMPASQILIAGLLSCLVAVLAVRALGQTDLNPVSGVGKLSQIVFAVVAPGHIIANIVAGAMAEAGAMQAGDLLQDLKTGHQLNASPRAQFYGQLIGATASVGLTVGAYQLYNAAYGVPSDQFKAPVALVWLKMAQLMQQGISALPPSALVFAKIFGAVGIALPTAEALLPLTLTQLMPSGMSVGVGMYLTPDFTIPRVLGALAELVWRKCDAASHQRSMLVVASGFVLGEGLWSIVALLIKLRF